MLRAVTVTVTFRRSNITGRGSNHPVTPYAPTPDPARPGGVGEHQRRAALRLPASSRPPNIGQMRVLNQVIPKIRLKMRYELTGEARAASNHTRVIRPTDSNAPTRETYLLWQVPRTVLGVRRVRGRDQRAIPGQPIFIGHPTYVRPRVADLVDRRRLRFRLLQRGGTTEGRRQGPCIC